MSLKRAFVGAVLVGALPAVVFAQGGSNAAPCDPAGPCPISSDILQIAPEPQTIVLLATGLAGVVAVVRTRRRK